MHRLRALEVELVSVPRLERATTRFGDRLLARLFTPAERAYVEGRARAGRHSLAARLAAKLAGRRALARLCPGDRALPALAELEVVRPPGRAPTLSVIGPRAARYVDLGLEMHLSLTHDDTFGIASLWVEAPGEDVRTGEARAEGEGA